jgi:hypothetical protein
MAAVQLSGYARPEQRRHSMRGDLISNDLPSIDEVLTDPSASHWLKSALQSALWRDAVDAANDSELLARLLEQRCDRILARSSQPLFRSD